MGSVIIVWRKDLPFQTGLLAPTPLIPVDLASYLQSCRAWAQCWGWRRSRTSCPIGRRSGKPLPRPDTRGTRSNCLGPFLGCDLRKDGQRSRQKNGQAEGKLPTFRGKASLYNRIMQFVRGLWPLEHIFNVTSYVRSHFLFFHSSESSVDRHSDVVYFIFTE